MPQYKDFLIIHPKKGNIKLGKLSHNELCRYCFNFILECKRLQQEFGKIKGVDPTSPAMQKMTKLVTSMSDEDLEQIIQAKIPFVSGIAISEKVRRKFQK